jgi:hypothetical protein
VHEVLHAVFGLVTGIRLGVEILDFIPATKFQWNDVIDFIATGGVERRTMKNPVFQIDLSLAAFRNVTMRC